MKKESKDTTEKWAKDMPHLQPKQGETQNITISRNADLKGDVIQKETKRKILTIRDGVPCWIHFDDENKEIRVEKVPGH